MNAAAERSVLRLFVAVPLPQEAAEAIFRWTEELSQHMSFRKWVHPQDYHITLQFLGDTDTENTAAVVSHLRQAAEGQKSFTLSLRGAGVFGQPTSPRVLWTGIDGEVQELYSLQQRVTDAMAPLGFKPEERPYRPHITTARKFIDGRISSPLLEQGPDSVSWTAGSMVLFRTVMHASPMYEIQEQVPFGS
ncbi:RNA 2',3'-cyclic phosphodiesterase [Paenibacillus lemnae]|uniref:RNA 2',3'-cyclic phosphodiesterase n=1 Tax=Paenibacillus lemnae TaxID=1330551 RepID=A0A848M3S9_PAELE|nr:RNA 2',3'-cyclic phosphodiesterase [Paenibacillus lemnae]NMO95688.1 RNA 2',3'-cyclic phosphodiesterase [Paenibacillus lemnae]